MQVFRSICVFAFAVSLGFAAEQAKKSALDKPTLEAYVRQVELLPPELKVTIGDPKPSLFADFFEVPVELTSPQGVYAMRYFVSKDGQKIVKGAIFDINKNPFEAEMKKVKTDLQPSFGAPGAPVVIAVFTDFECPNCREEAKVLRENIQKEFPNDVRVYYKDFPLEQMHPWSKAAAIAGRCVFRANPAAFWDYHDWIFEHQPEITADNLKDKVLEWAGQKNLDTLQLNSCIGTKATEKDVDKSIAEGRSLAVSGTPTLFINGRPLTGAIPWPTLSQVIKREIEYQKSAANAGEKCCEVTIPSLVK
jgi:protein-disulfide isomerase